MVGAGRDLWRAHALQRALSAGHQRKAPAANVRGARAGRARVVHCRARAAHGAADDADEFRLDLGDSRFSSVYSSSDFAIDPTNPKFRRTAGSEKLLKESIDRRHSKGTTTQMGSATPHGSAGDGEAWAEAPAAKKRPRAGERSSDEVGGGGVGDARRGDDQLSRLVASVKATAKRKPR